MQGEQPNLYLAPYAHRMTVDMLTQLPTALTLAITGARALCYPPKGEMPKKGIRVQTKGTRARENVKVKSKTIVGGEHPIETPDTGLGE
jgi:hypothetical protein